jgi:hypothetical protein
MALTTRISDTVIAMLSKKPRIPAGGRFVFFGCRVSINYKAYNSVNFIANIFKIFLVFSINIVNLKYLSNAPHFMEMNKWDYVRLNTNSKTFHVS